MHEQTLHSCVPLKCIGTWVNTGMLHCSSGSRSEKGSRIIFQVKCRCRFCDVMRVNQAYRLRVFFGGGLDVQIYMHSPTFQRLFFSHFWHIVQPQKLIKIEHLINLRYFCYYSLCKKLPFFNLHERLCLWLCHLSRYVKWSKARRFNYISAEK